MGSNMMTNYVENFKVLTVVIQCFPLSFVLAAVNIFLVVSITVAMANEVRKVD